MTEFYIKNKTRLFLWLAISLMTLMTMGQALYANVRLNERVDLLNEIGKVTSCITECNQQIQLAALAVSKVDRDDQLNKQQECMLTSDDSFNKILKMHLKKNELILFKIIYSDRNKFLIYQNTVVDAVRENVSDPVMWSYMAKYNEEQIKYLVNVNKLHDMVVDDIRAKYRWMLWYIIIVIFTGVLSADAYMTLLSRKILHAKAEEKRKYKKAEIEV